MAFSLDRTLMTLLFGSAGPLSAKDIQRVFARFHESREAAAEEAAAEEAAPRQPFLEAEGMPTSEVPSLVSVSQIREAMERIAGELDERDEVFRLVERHNGYALATAPAMGEWARLLREEPRPAKLARPALETLAVVAYRQPVTRAEIEKIRGVSADSALGKLLERELVHVVGRADLPGRPMQYGTTELFLEFVGVKTIEELPQSDALSPRQIDEWLREASSGKQVGDKEMGLPQDGAKPGSDEETFSPGAESSSEDQAEERDGGQALTSDASARAEEVHEAESSSEDRESRPAKGSQSESPQEEAG